jgi:hypothetical protein
MYQPEFTQAVDSTAQFPEAAALPNLNPKKLQLDWWRKVLQR